MLGCSVTVLKMRVQQNALANFQWLSVIRLALSSIAAHAVRRVRLNCSVSVYQIRFSVKAIMYTKPSTSVTRSAGAAGTESNNAQTVNAPALTDASKAENLLAQAGVVGADGGNRSSPMTVIGSVSGDGLGVIEWWT